MGKILFGLLAALFFCGMTAKDAPKRYIGFAANGMYIGQHINDAKRHNPSIHYDHNSDGFISLFDIDTLKLLSSAYLNIDADSNITGIAIAVTFNFSSSKEDEVKEHTDAIRFIKSRLVCNGFEQDEFEAGSFPTYRYYAGSAIE